MHNTLAPVRSMHGAMLYHAGVHPRSIGSIAWRRGFESAFGIDPDLIEVLLDRATESGRVSDPHALRLGCHVEVLADEGMLEHGSSRALEAAAWICFHQENPGYGVLMNLRLEVWLFADPQLHRWLIEQYAAMLMHGPEPVYESAWYSLGVDFCEDNSEGEIMVPGLVEWLNDRNRMRLLESSSAARWHACVPLMQWALRDRRRHPALARHLGHSAFSGFFNSYDVAGARRIAARLRLEDASLRAWLDERLAARLELRLRGVIADADGVRIALDWTTFAPSWFAAGTQLVSAGGETLGEVLQFRVSMDLLDPEAIAQQPDTQVWVHQPAPRSAAQWHRVTGEVEAWSTMVGTIVSVIGC